MIVRLFAGFVGITFTAAGSLLALFGAFLRQWDAVGLGLFVLLCGVAVLFKVSE